MVASIPFVSNIMFSSWIWSIRTSALLNHLSIFTVAMNYSHHRTYAWLLSTLMSHIRDPIVTAHHLFKMVLIRISSDLEVFSFLSCSESHLATNKAMSNLPSQIKSRTPWSFHSNGKIKGGKKNHHADIPLPGWPYKFYSLSCLTNITTNNTDVMNTETRENLNPNEFQHITSVLLIQKVSR